MRRPRKIKRKPNKDQQLLQVINFICRINDQDTLNCLLDEIEVKRYELEVENGLRIDEIGVLLCKLEEEKGGEK